jgi:cell division protein FtsL
MSRRAAAEARRTRGGKTAAHARHARTGKARARHPSSRVPIEKRPPSPKVRRRRTTLSSVLMGMAVIGFLFAFVYPTSTFFRQRSELGTAQEKLDRLRSETQRLQQESKKLQGPEEIERIAREQYGLVRPGETPYVLVPSAPATTTTQPATDVQEPADKKPDAKKPGEKT